MAGLQITCQTELIEMKMQNLLIELVAIAQGLPSTWHLYMLDSVTKQEIRKGRKNYIPESP